MTLRELLFADQDLGSLLSGLPREDRWRSPAAAANPWPLLFMAVELLSEGRADDAAVVLRRVAEMPGVETRVRLWAWRALREIGAQPEPPLAREVLGIVIELPMPFGVDTLAAYRDGTARYVNQGGAVWIFDGCGSKGRDKVARLLDSAQAVAGGLPLSPRRPAPRRRVRFSLLTRQGIRCAEEEFSRAGEGDSFLSPVFRNAAELMAALVKGVEPPPKQR